jgi:hypothetical protein
MSDGDCGFWLLAPSGFGGFSRSGKSLGLDRTVAATDPGSYLRLPAPPSRSQVLHGKMDQFENDHCHQNAEHPGSRFLVAR